MTPSGAQSVGEASIRAVVFDWGGVIQRTEDTGPRQQLDTELGLDPGSVERAVFESRVWQLASVGGCSADHAWGTIVCSLGLPQERTDEFVERFFAGDRIDVRLVRLIRSLQRRELCVGLLSNAPPSRSAGFGLAGRWGMEGLFDAQVFSHEVGTLKPDPRTYRAALGALGVQAAQALFIDDAPTNVRGALELGMVAYQFVGTDPLLSELCRLGLLETTTGKPMETSA